MQGLAHSKLLRSIICTTDPTEGQTYPLQVSDGELIILQSPLGQF